MNTQLANVSWADVVAAESGHVFLDKFEDGLRFIIMRGPASICAYVGVPESHPLAGHSYEDLPVQAHGGLTFSDKGGKSWPEGFWWYGWDYAHSGDFCTYDETRTYKTNREEKKWTPSEVEADSWSAIYDFKHLLKLAESIAAKVGERRA